MGKEIILPWTCKTSDKLKISLAIALMIGLPIATLTSLYYGLTTKDYFTGEILTLVFMINLLGTGLIWFIAFTLWGLSDLLPHFKCKQQSELEVKK